MGSKERGAVHGAAAADSLGSVRASGARLAARDVDRPTLASAASRSDSSSWTGVSGLRSSLSRKA